MQEPMSPKYAKARGILGNVAAIRFAIKIMIKIPDMITPLTCQVLPRAMAALLMFWTSKRRNAAPRKKKCQCPVVQLPVTAPSWNRHFV